MTTPVTNKPGAWALIKSQMTVKKKIQNKNSFDHYYNYLVLNVRENKWDAFSENLKVMVNGDIPFTATDLTNIIQVCGSYEKSLKCLDLVDRAIISVSHFTQILGYCRAPAEGEKLYNLVISAKLSPDADFVSRLLTLFRKNTELLEKGQQVVANLRKKHKVVGTSSLYANLYQLFKHCKGDEKKLDLYDSWVAEDKVSRNSALVKQQISACPWTDSGQRRAEEYFRSLEKLPQIGVLNALINVYASSKNALEPIESILYNMRHNKIAPNETTYKHWLKALGNSSGNTIIETRVNSYFAQYGLAPKSSPSTVSKKSEAKRLMYRSTEKYENLDKRKKETIDPYAARNFMLQLNSCKTSEQAVDELKKKLDSADSEMVDAGHFSKVMKGVKSCKEAYDLYLLMLKTEIEPDPVVYDVLIRKAVNEDKIDQAEKIEYHGIKNGDIQKAEQIFNRDKNPSPVSVLALLKVYKNARDLKKAESFFCRMRKEGRCDDYIYTSLFDICSVCNGGMDKLIQYEQWMTHDEVIPNAATVTCKIRCCSLEQKGFEKADQLFNSFPKDLREIQLYNALLNLYAEAPNRWRRVENIFKDIPKAMRTVETYNIMFKACANNKIKDEDIDSYYAEMPSELVDSSTVSALIRTCILSGNYKKAEKYYQLLKEAPPITVIIPLISVCSIAAKTVEPNSKELSEIRELVRKYYKTAVDHGYEKDNILIAKYLDVVPEDPILIKLIKEQPTTDVYNLRIRRSESLPEALRLKREMESRGLQPSVATYGILINQCAVCGGDIVQAEKLYLELVSSGFVADEVVIGALIKVCVKAGGAIQKALSYFQIFLDNGGVPNVILFNTLLDVCAAAGDLAMADRVLLLMKKHSVAKDIKTYNTLIKVCSSDKGNRDRANSEFTSIEYPLRAGVDTFTSMINVVISEEGSVFDDAEMYYKLMTEYPVGLASVDCLKPDAAAITSMIVACTVFRQDRAKVDTYWEQFKKGGVHIDAIAYGAMIRYHATLGEYPEAKSKFLEGLNKFPRSQELIHSMIRAAITSNQRESEIVWIRQVMNDKKISPTLTTYNRLLLYYSTFSSKRKVSLLLNEMRHNGFYPNLATYHIKLLKAKNLSEVNSILQDMYDLNLETNFYIDSLVREHVQKEYTAIFSLSKEPLQYSEEENSAFMKSMFDKGFDSVAVWKFHEVSRTLSVKRCNDFLRLYASLTTQFRKVEKIFSAIETPDVETFRIVFMSSSKSNCNRETVEKYIMLLKKLDSFHDLEPLIVDLYNRFIALSSNIQELLSIQKAMKQLGIKPNVITYQHLFHYCAINGGDIIYANNLYKQMISNSIVPDRQVFNTLVEVCIKAGGDIQKGLFYFKKMTQIGISPDEAICHRLLYLCLAAGGDYKSAKVILTYMKKHKISQTSVTEEILYSIRRIYKRSWSTSKEMVQLADTSDGTESITESMDKLSIADKPEKRIVQKDSISNPATLNLILEAIFLKSEDIVDIVKKQLEKYKDTEVITNATTAGCKVRYLGLNNRYKEAKNFFDKAICKSPSSYELYHSLIIAAIFSHEESSEIEKIVKAMQLSRISPHLTTINLLLSYYLWKGDTNSVSNTLHRIAEEGFSPNITTYYIQLLAGDNLLQANRILNEMTEKGISLNPAIELVVKQLVCKDIRKKREVALPLDVEGTQSIIQGYLNLRLHCIAEILFFSFSEEFSLPLIEDQITKINFEKGNRHNFIRSAALSKDKYETEFVSAAGDVIEITIKHQERSKIYILAQLLKNKKSHVLYIIKDKNPNVSSKWYEEALTRYKSPRKILREKDRFVC